MLFKSELFTEASGSIGTVTAGNTSAGLMLRSKPNKIQKPTADQIIYQNAVKDANNAWKEKLTTEALNSWQAYANEQNRINASGNIPKVSAYTAYFRGAVLIRQFFHYFGRTGFYQGYEIDTPAIEGVESIHKLGRPDLTFYYQRDIERWRIQNNTDKDINVAVYISSQKVRTNNKARGAFKILNIRDIEAFGYRGFNQPYPKNGQFVKAYLISKNGNLSEPYYFDVTFRDTRNG